MTHSDAATQLALQFQALNSYLNTDGDGVTALRRLVDLACSSIPGCEWAAITELPARKPPHTLACSGDVARKIDEVQYTVGQGPCLDAATLAEPVLSPDLATEARWPEFSAAATAATPVRAMMAFHLADGPPRSALNVYASAPNAFGEEGTTIGALFAAHARVLMIHLVAANKAANLTEALSTSRQIGTAIGILMAAHKVTSERAFEMLRGCSQTLHRKLRDIALEVADTGELPATDRAVRSW